MRALVVCAAPFAGEPEHVRLLYHDADIVVGVDGGTDLCRRCGITPDLVVGDLDSVDPSTPEWLAVRDVEVLTLPVAKDVTDLDATLDLLVARGVEEVVLVAASGGRLDHALAVIGSLSRAAGLRPRLAEPQFDAWLLDAEKGRTSVRIAPEGATFSAIAVEDGVVASVSGAEWTLERAALTRLSSRGLSNRVVGEAAEVTVHAGALLAVRIHGTL